MTQELDPRIVILTIETDDGKEEFKDLYIRAMGTKMDNFMLNEAEIHINNLKKETRDYLIRKTSPFFSFETAGQRRPVYVTLDVGRESYGTFRIFKGNCIAADITQPPDIGLTIRSMTGYANNVRLTSISRPSVDSIRNIAAKVAEENEVELDFQATDRNVANFSYTGSAQGLIRELDEIGGINVFVDDDTLHVKDADKTLENKEIIINARNGMIGIPKVTETGIHVKMLIDRTAKIGGKLTIESDLNPAANGSYEIYRLSFDVANRDTPFYYVAECKWIRGLNPS